MHTHSTSMSFFSARQICPVSRVQHKPSSSADQKKGFFGFVSFDLDRFGKLSARIRRSREGRFYITYPREKSEGGAQFSSFTPRSREVQDAIELQVFSEIRAMANLEIGLPV